MYPFVEASIIDMQQRKIDLSKILPANHPLQPPVIEPIQSIHAAAEGEGDCVGIDLANTNVSSSTPNSPPLTTQATEITEHSIIPNLESHYLGELPEYVSNSEIASDIASDEVMTECTPQHESNQDMTSTTNPDSVLIPQLSVPEQPTSEQSVSELTINNQSTTTNIQTDPKTSINDCHRDFRVSNH